MTDDERDAVLRATARTSANTLLIVEKLATGLREDLGQVYGRCWPSTATRAVETSRALSPGR